MLGCKGRKEWKYTKEKEEIKSQGMDSGRRERKESGVQPSLKQLKDIKTFWESDHKHAVRKASIVRPLQSLIVFFALLTNLEKGGFIFYTLGVPTKQVINVTKQGDVLPQHSCQASLMLSVPI